MRPQYVELEKVMADVLLGRNQNTQVSVVGFEHEQISKKGRGDSMHCAIGRISTRRRMSQLLP
jgi:hypothetical protein